MEDKERTDEEVARAAFREEEWDREKWETTSVVETWFNQGPVAVKSAALKAEGWFYYSHYNSDDGFTCDTFFRKRPGFVERIDKVIKCKTCQKSFTFTVREQAKYLRRGHVAPKRCPDCLAKRSQERADREDSPIYTTTNRVHAPTTPTPREYPAPHVTKPVSVSPAPPKRTAILSKMELVPDVAKADTSSNIFWWVVVIIIMVIVAFIVGMYLAMNFL